MLGAVVVVLGLAVAPALAAAPEAPEVTTEGVTTTGATFHGILNPHAEEPTGGGTYKFLYKASKTQCTSGTETTPGLSLGQPAEEVFEPVSGLTPGTTYEVCLSVTNLESQTTVSAPVSFKTALTPEAPKTNSPAAHITATGATLEGILNPKAAVATTDGWYFAYATAAQGPACTDGAASPTEPEEAAKAKHEATAVTGLEPGREYRFCMVATNEIGEATPGNEVKFNTPAAPPAVESEGTSGVTSTTATLEAQVNPDNEATHAHLQYSTSASVNGSGGLTAPTVLASSELGEGYGLQPVGSGALTGLPAGTTFYYQAVATNTTGTTYGAVQSFTTLPKPTTAAIAAITATTATLNGSLTPLSSSTATEYSFAYRSGSECTGESVTTPESVGTGSGTENVSAEVTGLSPNTQYTVCLVSSNEFGSEQGSLVTFTTLVAAPAIESESASDVDATEARLEASINPGNSATSYYFEYGPDPGSYDASAPVPPGEIHAALSDVDVNTVLTGLTPATTYHYRVVASNALPGAVDGEDQSFTTAAARESGSSASCPNEARRIEQPHATTLPDCRAYEMVSPLNTNGQDATEPSAETAPRAGASGEAVAYASKGSFEGAVGNETQDEYISRRGANGWATQSISPPHHAYESEPLPPFRGADFTPDLGAGIVSSNVALTGEAPEGVRSGYGLYVDEFPSGPYRYVGLTTGAFPAPLGASTDLSHVVFAPKAGAVSEWVDGAIYPVAVANSGEGISGSVGSQYQSESFTSKNNVWNAVSATGARVYFTSPGEQEKNPTETTVGTLYLRDNADRPQSALEHAEANATGTLVEGSTSVTELTAVPDVEATVAIATGSAQVTVGNLQESEGRSGLSFSAGQPVSGTGIPAGTTITKVSGSTLTLSASATETNGAATLVSYHAAPFAVGDRITGYGIPPGATIEAVAPTELTLSVPAAVSGSAVAINAGGECTEAEQACTVDVSASERTVPDTHGPQSARYWGASADGQKVFFTSNEELTDDADTGPADNAPNLYEYDLAGPEGERLRDLTVDPVDADGAAVQGVVQISEGGAYVYFVATGALTGSGEAPLRNGAGEEPVAEADNLYVSREGGALAFIATLDTGDRADWAPYTVEDEGLQVEEDQAGPTTTTAAVTPSGTALAFMSERSLPTTNFPHGYDNAQVETGDCEREVAPNEYETGACHEIYLYSAETGDSLCASCDPSEQQPTGPASLSKPFDTRSLYRPRNLLADGTLFFNSSDALVPQASGSQQNVYEYEDGHIYPISNVSGSYSSFFMDANGSEEGGEEGANVFFGSADSLLPEDQSENVVVWDARVDGGFPVALATSSCESAEACQASSAPQPSIFGTPPSATFSGPGNASPPAPTVIAKAAPKKKTAAQLKAEKLAKALRQCRKDKRKVARKACEAAARKRYGAKKSSKKARKASRGPEASR
jgi:hypothetical protein